MFGTRIGHQISWKHVWLLTLLVLVSAPRTMADDCTLQLFSTPLHFSNGATTVRVAVADFNNDGNLDVAATAHDSSFVGVFIGDGSGNFVRQTVLPAGNFSVPVSAGDFNNDGKQDLAVGSRDGTVWIYLGNGDGTFSSPTRYADGPGEGYEIAVADFNQDGKLDLAIGHQFGGLAIMIGDGNGGFSLTNTYLSGLGPVLVQKADLNNDGKTDLLTANAQGGNTSILLGDGAGGFSVSTGSFPPGALGDFNKDGNIDVAISGNDGVSILVYLGDGHGGIASVNRFYTGMGGATVASDFNGDGNLDVATVNGSTNQMAVIFGDGTGNFGSPSTLFTTGNGSGDPMAGDFNHDGRPDIVMANYYGGDITVLLNNGNSRDTAPPTIAITNNTTIATSSTGAVVSYNVSAVDNSGRVASLTCSVPSGGSFPIGTTPITCTAADYCGNAATQKFNITVIADTVPPTISISNNTTDATSSAGAVVSYEVSAVDNSGRVASLNCSIPSGSTFPIGTTPITCTASDFSGNTGSQNFNITVIDQPPVLSLPSDIHAMAAVSTGAVVTYAVSATDAVSGPLPVSCNRPSGSTFPIGNTTVTCSATDGAGHTATGTFNVNVFGCIGCIQPTFEPSRNYGIDGGNPFRTAAGDFNNDGKMDLAETVPGSVAIFYGDGAGNFAAPIYLPAGGFDVPPASGDFNHDGKTDLAVGSSDGVVYIYLNNGTGLNQPVTYADHGGEAYEIAVADFNSDGNVDLAIGHQFSGLAILFGDGHGGFADPVDYLQGNGPVQVSKGDFNGDGKIDLITANAGTGDTSLLINNGDGTFTVSSVPIPPTDFAVADFNGDGKTDVVAGTGDGAVGLYLGDGHGGFTAAGSFDTSGSGVNGIKAGDFNGDGKMDIVVTNGWSDIASVLLGDGHGGLSPAFTFSTASGPIGITVIDLTGDGKPDIAAAAYFAGQISVLINTTYQTPVGPNSFVTVNNTTFTFDDVTTGGTTSVTPIDPASVGQVPGGFSVSDSVAYEIATTATFTGSVTLAFKVPGPISQADFNNLAILHNVNGNLVDVTATTPARDYSNLTIYATTNSFSPFYLARRGTHINTLFEQTKAYKGGSTIPIKLQLLNASNANISSSNTSLVTRDLRLTSGNTLAPVTDSGNANPDYAFRYDSTLGGTGGGYIFNLATKGLVSGQYVLSFYVGSERSFFYTVKFEVK